MFDDKELDAVLLKGDALFVMDARIHPTTLGISPKRMSRSEIVSVNGYKIDLLTTIRVASSRLDQKNLAGKP